MASTSASVALVNKTSTRRHKPEWIMGLALALGTAWAVTGPFRSHAFWMNFEQDDFFYYLKIAQNLATGHGSTFNGLVATNGYHPLWMLCLAAVIRLGAGPHAIFVFLAISIWVATISSFALAWLLLSRSGITAWASSTCAAFVAVYCMHLFVEGMEVTLAVPLMIAVLVAVQQVDWWSRPRSVGGLRTAMIGLLVSAMVLARLDTAIFAALLALGIAAQRALRERVRLPQLTGIAVGCLPVFAYLLINRLSFGIWMPISGMAKELKLDHGFTSKAWRTFLELSGTQLLNVAFIFVALLLLPWMGKRLRPIERAIGLAALLFPFVYFGALSWLSDWRLWGWYFYSLRSALCVALLVLFRTSLMERLARTPAMAGFVLFTLFRIARLTWDEQASPMMIIAVEVQQFALTHPGVYAMGDRAGSVGYLLPDPLVQTEGLVMDRRFLDAISKQTPLREALEPYHVRYYIASAMTPYSGCFHAVEPWQAGVHSPHMRAEFCQPPIARWKHGTVETLIFDLSKP